MLPLLGFHISIQGSGGVPTWFVVTAAGIALLSISACVWSAKYASRKGFPFVPILIVALVVSFPVVLLIVALAPARQPPAGSMPPHWRKW